MIKPNLFILGAPKSGTTSIHNWLDSSDEVCMSVIKEPRFYCNFSKSDFDGPGIEDFFSDNISIYEEYVNIFSKNISSKVLGESSTDYLSSLRAAKNIKNAEVQNLKFIIILRNPVHRAFSEYLHTKRDNIEDQTFIKSLDLEKEGTRKSFQPLFHHIKRGKYAESLKVYFEYFDKSQFYIETYDMLKQNPQLVFDSICNFLNIEKFKINEQEKHNASGIPRIKMLHHLENPNNHLHSLLKLIFPKKLIRSMKFFVQKYNLRKELISEEDWIYAYSFFKTDIEEVEFLIGKDLSKWKRYHEQ